MAPYSLHMVFPSCSKELMQSTNLIYISPVLYPLISMYLCIFTCMNFCDYQLSNLSATSVSTKKGLYNEKNRYSFWLYRTQATQNKGHWNVSMFTVVLLCIQSVCGSGNGIHFCEWALYGERIVLLLQEQFESSLLF